MPAYEDQIDYLAENHLIENKDYIVPGHSKVKTKFIVPLGPVTVGQYEYSTFLFQFSPQGITLFALNQQNKVCGSQTIQWKEITKFKVRSGLLENTMILEAGGEKLNLKLSNKVLGSPWVSENIKRLQECNYFYSPSSEQ